jgi:hypothetical protein
MKNLKAYIAATVLVGLSACSSNAPAPTPTPDTSVAAPDCGPKCQQHEQNHK